MIISQLNIMYDQLRNELVGEARKSPHRSREIEKMIGGNELERKRDIQCWESLKWDGIVRWGGQSEVYDEQYI